MQNIILSFIQNMLNNEVYLKTSAEVCTQVGSYFDIVDNCISLADTNKQYTINPQTY